MQTTKLHVQALLENFAEYVNPEGQWDPWFELGEINQQFALEDVSEDQLYSWLQDFVDEGLVEQGPEGYRWLS